VQAAFRQQYPAADFRPTIEFFETGGSVKFSDTDPARTVLTQLERIPGLLARFGDISPEERAALGEFILEGLWAIDKIGRNEERGFVGVERKAAAQDLYRDYTMERNRYKKPLN
jgi:hypothetical protein